MDKIHQRNQYQWASILILLTALIQSSASLFEGSDYIISMLTTLTIGYLTYLTPRGGFLGFLISSLIVGLITSTEFPTLLLITGPLGISLGWSQYLKKGALRTAINAGIIMAMGMYIMTFFLDIPVFKGQLESLYPNIQLVQIYFLFALSYAWLCFRILNSLTHCVHFPLTRKGVSLHK
ncbi:MAG: hypothetical protein KAX49_02730 [Halanaerobiales bacterium]|nr:hypothetical protein [Halanaerobiales bacterium]